MFRFKFITILTLSSATAFIATNSTLTAQACHPSYKGVCLPPNGPDVDCAGGSGNGPLYAQGPFRVVGPDPYRLDRDKDGIACE